MSKNKKFSEKTRANLINSTTKILESFLTLDLIHSYYLSEKNSLMQILLNDKNVINNNEFKGKIRLGARDISYQTKKLNNGKIEIKFDTENESLFSVKELSLYNEDDLRKMISGKTFTFAKNSKNDWCVSTEIECNNKKAIIGGPEKIGSNSSSDYRLFKVHLQYIKIYLEKLQGKNFDQNYLVSLTTGSGKTFSQALKSLIGYFAGTQVIHAALDSSAVQFYNDFKRIVPDSIIDDIQLITENEKSEGLNKPIVIGGMKNLLSNYGQQLADLNSDKTIFESDESHLFGDDESLYKHAKKYTNHLATAFYTATLNPALEELGKDENGKPLEVLITMSNKDKVKAGYASASNNYEYKTPSFMKMDRESTGLFTAIKNQMARVADSLLDETRYNMANSYVFSTFFNYAQTESVKGDKTKKISQDDFRRNLRWLIQPSAYNNTLICTDDASVIAQFSQLQEQIEKKAIAHKYNLTKEQQNAQPKGHLHNEIFYSQYGMYSTNHSYVFLQYYPTNKFEFDYYNDQQKRMFMEAKTRLQNKLNELVESNSLTKEDSDKLFENVTGKVEKLFLHSPKFNKSEENNIDEVKNYVDSQYTEFNKIKGEFKLFSLKNTNIDLFNKLLKLKNTNPLAYSYIIRLEELLNNTMVNGVTKADDTKWIKTKLKISAKENEKLKDIIFESCEIFNDIKNYNDFRKTLFNLLNTNELPELKSFEVNSIQNNDHSNQKQTRESKLTNLFTTVITPDEEAFHQLEKFIKILENKSYNPLYKSDIKINQKNLNEIEHAFYDDLYKSYDERDLNGEFAKLSNIFTPSSQRIKIDKKFSIFNYLNKNIDEKDKEATKKKQEIKTHGHKKDHFRQYKTPDNLTYAKYEDHLFNNFVGELSNKVDEIGNKFNLDEKEKKAVKEEFLENIRNSLYSAPVTNSMHGVLDLAFSIAESFENFSNEENEAKTNNTVFKDYMSKMINRYGKTHLDKNKFYNLESFAKNIQAEAKNIADTNESLEKINKWLTYDKANNSKGLPAKYAKELAAIIHELYQEMANFNNDNNLQKFVDNWNVDQNIFSLLSDKLREKLYNFAINNYKLYNFEYKIEDNETIELNKPFKGFRFKSAISDAISNFRLTQKPNKKRTIDHLFLGFNSNVTPEPILDNEWSKETYKNGAELGIVSMLVSDKGTATAWNNPALQQVALITNKSSSDLAKPDNFYQLIGRLRCLNPLMASNFFHIKQDGVKTDFGIKQLDSTTNYLKAFKKFKDKSIKFIGPRLGQNIITWIKENSDYCHKVNETELVNKVFDFIFDEFENLNKINVYKFNLSKKELFNIIKDAADYINKEEKISKEGTSKNLINIIIRVLLSIGLYIYSLIFESAEKRKLNAEVNKLISKVNKKSIKLPEEELEKAKLYNKIVGNISFKQNLEHMITMTTYTTARIPQITLDAKFTNHALNDIIKQRIIPDNFLNINKFLMPENYYKEMANRAGRLEKHHNSSLLKKEMISAFKENPLIKNSPIESYKLITALVRIILIDKRNPNIEQFLTDNMSKLIVSSKKRDDVLEQFLSDPELAKVINSVKEIKNLLGKNPINLAKAAYKFNSLIHFEVDPSKPNFKQNLLRINAAFRSLKISNLNKEISRIDFDNLDKYTSNSPEILAINSKLNSYTVKFNIYKEVFRLAKGGLFKGMKQHLTNIFSETLDKINNTEESKHSRLDLKVATTAYNKILKDEIDKFNSEIYDLVHYRFDSKELNKTISYLDKNFNEKELLLLLENNNTFEVKENTDNKLIVKTSSLFADKDNKTEVSFDENKAKILQMREKNKEIISIFKEFVNDYKKLKTDEKYAREFYTKYFSLNFNKVLEEMEKNTNQSMDLKSLLKFNRFYEVSEIITTLLSSVQNNLNHFHKTSTEGNIAIFNDNAGIPSLIASDDLKDLRKFKTKASDKLISGSAFASWVNAFQNITPLVDQVKVDSYYMEMKKSKEVEKELRDLASKKTKADSQFSKRSKILLQSLKDEEKIDHTTLNSLQENGTKFRSNVERIRSKFNNEVRASNNFPAPAA